MRHCCCSPGIWPDLIRNLNKATIVSQPWPGRWPRRLRGLRPLPIHLLRGKCHERTATCGACSDSRSSMSLEGGLVRHAGEASARARGLRDACVNWLPRPSAALLPRSIASTRRWLKRSCSPYARRGRAPSPPRSAFPGIWFLNGCYQWGCTSLARDEDGVPWLARTLDWPFPGLGRYLEVARMRGPAGDFDQRHLARLCRLADGARARALRRLASIRRRCGGARYGRGCGPTT